MAVKAVITRFRFKVRGRLLSAWLRRQVRPNEECTRLGSQYGGWWVPLGRINASSVVYSFGVGEDTTFDEALIAATGCRIDAFDPTPKAVEHARKCQQPNFHMHEVALWGSDGGLDLFLPIREDFASYSVQDRSGQGQSIRVTARTLPTIMEELGHQRVDLLKMDIEGAEAVALDALISGSWPRPLVLGVELELDEPVPATISRVRALLRLGYRVLQVEGRNACLVLQ